MTNKQLELLLKHITWGFYCVVFVIRATHNKDADLTYVEWPDLGPWPELEGQTND